MRTIAIGAVLGIVAVAVLRLSDPAGPLSRPFVMDVAGNLALAWALIMVVWGVIRGLMRGGRRR